MVEVMLCDFWASASKDVAASALILLEPCPDTTMEEAWYDLLKTERPHGELRPQSAARHVNEAIENQLFLSQPANWAQRYDGAQTNPHGAEENHYSQALLKVPTTES